MLMQSNNTHQTRKKSVRQQKKKTIVHWVAVTLRSSSKILISGRTRTLLPLLINLWILPGTRRNHNLLHTCQFGTVKLPNRHHLREFESRPRSPLSPPALQRRSRKNLRGLAQIRSTAAPRAPDRPTTERVCVRKIKLYSSMRTILNLGSARRVVETISGKIVSNVTSKTSAAFRLNIFVSDCAATRPTSIAI